MLWIGIDNGLTGAVASYNDATGTVTSIVDTPTYVVQKPNLRKGGVTKLRNRTMYDDAAMYQLLAGICAGERGRVRVVIEEAVPAPIMAKQRIKGQLVKGQPVGAASIFAVGLGFGIWRGILASIQVPYERVHPATWKAEMLRGSPRGKESARIKALELFPEAAPLLSRKMDHNRAEALLILEWGKRRWSGR
jgi:hypothetical protein